MLLLPAFAEVRAGGFLTDRVQLQVAHQLARLGHFRRGRRLGAYPVRLAQHRGIRAMCLFRMADRLVSNSPVSSWRRIENHGHDAVLFTPRSEEHTAELPSLMRTAYAVLCLIKKNYTT